MTQKIDLNTIVMDPDPDAKTEGLDRGDDFVPDDEPVKIKQPELKEPVKAPEPKAKEPEKKEPERERDPKTGKFVKEEKVEDPDEPDEPDEPTKDKDEPDEPTKDKDDKKPQMVPLTRLNAVIAQRNELSAMLAAKDKEEKAARKDDRAEIKEIDTKLADLYEKVEEARAEGKTKEAAAMQRQIATFERQIGSIEGAATARAEALLASENREYDAMLRTLAESDERYDADSEEFDQTVVRRTEFYVDSFIKGGMTPTQALREATMAMTGKDLFSTGKRAQRIPKVAEKEPEKVEPKKVEPKKTDVEKNVKRAKQQPPDTSDKVGPEGDGKLDVYGMSDEDFAKLPEAKKRQLRGDDNDD